MSMKSLSTLRFCPMKLRMRPKVESGSTLCMLPPRKSGRRRKSPIPVDITARSRSNRVRVASWRCLAGAERLCRLTHEFPLRPAHFQHSSTSRNRVRRKAFRVFAATLVSRLMDERARRNFTRAAEIGPAFPLTFRPFVLPFPENFGNPPKSRQRLVHHCIGVGGGIGAGFSEHDVHPAGTDKKTRVDCLVEHPLKGYLGEAALRFRIAAPHIAVHTRKPDLLEVAGAALRQAILRHPEICRVVRRWRWLGGRSRC